MESVDKGESNPVSEVRATKGSSNVAIRCKEVRQEMKPTRIRVAFGENWGSNGTGGKGYRTIANPTGREKVI